MIRLEKALSGDALDTVKGYFKRPSCIDMTIEYLENDFGPKASLITDLLRRCQKLPQLDSSMQHIKKFALQAIIMSNTIQRSKNHHFGSMLVEVLQKKLGTTATIHWGRFQVATGDSSYDGFID